MGDARGIGPEVLLKTVAGPELEREFEPLLIGVESLLRAQAQSLWPRGLPGRVEKALERVVDVGGNEESIPELKDSRGRNEFLLGRPEICGRWAGKSVERAVGLVREGRAEAIVTAPLDKRALNQGGYNYPGHTEMLSSLAGGVEVAMMLAGEGLRVVPATTHVALARVPSLVTVELLVGQCRVIDKGLRELFAIEKPDIALCGLNPHLGDGGLAGDEDQRVVAAAVKKARQAGLAVHGPFPADTVFLRAVRGEFQAVLAMYHDQAMIAIKMHSLGRGVNITLGLPFVRTSPDHGTALDIAGRGIADPGSMIEAARLAAQLCRSGKRRDA